MLLIDRNATVPFDFEGLSIRDLTGSANKSASFAQIDVPPGVSHRPSRSRRSDKYYYSLEGALSFIVGKKKLALEPGDLLVVERGEWFAYRNDEPSPAQLLLIHVPSFNLDAEDFRDEMPK